MRSINPCNRSTPESIYALSLWKFLLIVVVVASLDKFASSVSNDWRMRLQRRQLSGFGHQASPVSALPRHFPRFIRVQSRGNEDCQSFPWTIRILPELVEDSSLTVDKDEEDVKASFLFLFVDNHIWIVEFSMTMRLLREAEFLHSRPNTLRKMYSYV